MSVSSQSQLGFVNETTYGTPVAVSRFYEFEKESIVGSYQRIDSTALRSGARVQRADRWTPNPKGAAGSVDLELLSKGYGYWLQHILGSVATGTVNTDGFYTHTGTVGDLTGKSFTAQVGRVDVTSTVFPFTYGGGKVLSWEISNSVDGIAMLSLDMDFSHEWLQGDSGSGSAGTLATVTYPTGSELMSSLGASFKIGGTELPVKDISIKGDSGLAADRYMIRASGDKREPIEAPLRQYSWECTVEFEGLTQLQRVVSLTTAGALGAISASFRSPTITGATYPNLSITAAAARWDDPPPNTDGANILSYKIGGKILAPTDGSSPITIAYQTTDTTP